MTTLFEPSFPIIHSMDMGAESAICISAETMLPTLPAGGVGLGSASQLLHSCLDIPVKDLRRCVETASDLSSQGALESRDSSAIFIISFGFKPDFPTLECPDSPSKVRSSLVGKSRIFAMMS